MTAHRLGSTPSSRSVVSRTGTDRLTDKNAQRLVSAKARSVPTEDADQYPICNRLAINENAVTVEDH